MQVDSQKEIQWRQLTMEILEKCPASGKGGAPSDIINAESRIRACAENMSQQIIQECQPLLKVLDGHECAQRQSDLEGLIKTMVEISTLCFQQKVQVRTIYTKKDLAEFGHSNFSASSDLFEGRSSFGICEPDDISKDGHGVGFVIRPAIIAVEAKRNPKETRYIVWQKGVVWLVDPTEVSAKRQSGKSGTSKRKRSSSPVSDEEDNHTESIRPGNAPSQESPAASQDVKSKGPKCKTLSQETSAGPQDVKSESSKSKIPSQETSAASQDIKSERPEYKTTLEAAGEKKANVAHQATTSTESAGQLPPDQPKTKKKSCRARAATPGNSRARAEIVDLCDGSSPGQASIDGGEVLEAPKGHRLDEHGAEKAEKTDTSDSIEMIRKHEFVGKT